MEDTTYVISAPGVLANDTDADQDPLTAIKVANPTHGTVTVNSNGSFTYTPTTGYTGADSFTYKANDGTVDSNTATVNITVNQLWSGADIGTVDAAGSYVENSGTFTIEGSGAGITGTSDEHYYVYKSLSGDGEIVARVVSVENTNFYARGGVMIRETLDADSRRASLTIATSSYGISWQRRLTVGGNSQNTTVASETTPKYLKLVRSGNDFSGYYSSDGVNWTQAGSTVTITMTTNVHIGLAVSANNDGQLCTCVTDNVSAD